MTTAQLPVIALDQEYVYPTYDRAPVIFVRGEGAKLYDDAGGVYLDFLSGIAVNALGHNHPRIVATLADQASKIIHVSNLFHNEFQAPLAERLCDLSGMHRVFFCNSGTEAIEAAIKVSRNRAFRAAGGRPHAKFEIVALTNSFHGRTLGALSLTGQEKYRQPFEPLIPGVRFVAPNDVEALKRAVNQNTGAVIVEPIQGEGGIQILTQEFLDAARAVCDQHRALLVFDEVQCGLGRTGRYFAFQGTEIEPDLVTLAKPLGLGIPMGALLGAEDTRDDFTAGVHGSTFAGGPLACRLSLEFFNIMEEQEFLPRIVQRGAYLYDRLCALQRKFAFVKDVRGRGLMLGMELTFPGKKIVRSMLQRGFVINCAHEKVLRFLPPYIITESQIDQMVSALDGVLQTI
jgi:acetylornithine/N-succinyldiaminopimelate aminotransferase